jgi:hypothetical protein
MKRYKLLRPYYDNQGLCINGGAIIEKVLNNDLYSYEHGSGTHITFISSEVVENSPVLFKAITATATMNVMEQIKAVQDRNCKELEALACLTGLTVAEIETDLTVPDPGIGEVEQERS